MIVASAKNVNPAIHGVKMSLSDILCVRVGVIRLHSKEGTPDWEWPSINLSIHPTIRSVRTTVATPRRDRQTGNQKKRAWRCDTAEEGSISFETSSVKTLFVGRPTSNTSTRDACKVSWYGWAIVLLFHS